MASQRLRHLVCLILLQTWTWESLGKDSQTAVYELRGQQNVLEFIQQTVNKLRPVSSLGPGAKVVFDVKLSGNGHTVNPTNPIIYDKVNMNKGEGYSRKTGKFTAPRCGLYFFSYSSLPGRGTKTDVQLLKNNTRVSLIHSVLPKGSSQLSMRNIILELHKGDKVWVQLVTGTLWSEGGSLSFQGFLLGQ
ncbi:complement C1q tumor necrosis factor-related protein 3-like [Pristis pectinata]|uniref:complement C1q tumor necrosis factor-related protein 3-like n=1 Tax=Pristis pectinata TaxID=685728 RepID=UPI00223E6A1E|nr:complement C1q tumor necrosis factor-related protein 3-like [Pristis pectinata]